MCANNVRGGRARLKEFYVGDLRMLLVKGQLNLLPSEKSLDWPVKSAQIERLKTQVFCTRFAQLQRPEQQQQQQRRPDNNGANLVHWRNSTATNK